MNKVTCSLPAPNIFLVWRNYISDTIRTVLCLQSVKSEAEQHHSEVLGINLIFTENLLFADNNVAHPGLFAVWDYTKSLPLIAFTKTLSANKCFTAAWKKVFRFLQNDLKDRSVLPCSGLSLAR